MLYTIATLMSKAYVKLAFGPVKYTQLKFTGLA